MERVAGDGSGYVWCVQSILHLALGWGTWELCAGWAPLGGPSGAAPTAFPPRPATAPASSKAQVHFFRGKICGVLAQISVSAGVCRQDHCCFR